MCDTSEFSFRTAVESDLPYLSALSQAPGQDIVPGGGDFVTHAWSHWWTQHPQMHYNQWVFNGDVGVGFARIEVYGTPEEPESGWLEGLRVHRDYQGKGVMKLVVTPLLEQVPARVKENMYLAVGSGNSQMCPVADKKYTYLGAQVGFGKQPVAAAPSDSQERAKKMSVADAEALWTFLSAHPLYKSSRLVLPGRFYGFRSCTRAALEDKLAAGRVYAVFETTDCGDSGVPAILGVFFTFDTDLDMGSMLMQWHTSFLCDGLSAEQVTSVLRQWSDGLPTETDAGAAISVNVLSVGPVLNVDGTPDVEPFMQEALDALGFNRSLQTHLRVYRM